jgi:hypothetical protein
LTVELHIHLNWVHGETGEQASPVPLNYGRKRDPRDIRDLKADGFLTMCFGHKMDYQ